MAPRACLCGRVNCTQHRRRTPSTGARYGADHQERVRRLLLTSPEICARCGGGPRPGDPWEGGHVIDAVNGGGPELQREHRSCNRAAGARTKAERMKAQAEARAQQRIAETYRYLEAVR